ncbi:hypothetical protein Pth03_10630 [Planotetraspora thailandica]|uniref:Uncharacterized protein n=2 Tax=Planotetraspora thailandica TaxID=487172 RepID=A0A8J3UVC0_9ACTN|nr:hypothetical protein Pth03_10630 [Planotetraspora thailandica]
MLSAFLTYDTEMPLHVRMYVPLIAVFDVPRETIAAGLNRSCPPDECSCKDICLQDAGFGWLQAILQLPWTDPLHAWISRQNLEEFLVHSFAMVPVGRELSDYDWDASFRKLCDPDR